MSIENTHRPQVPNFPPQDPTNNETTATSDGDKVPDTAYEALGGVPGNPQASAENFKYPSSVGPASAWTEEQTAAFKKIVENDPTFQIDPTDTTFPDRVVAMAAAIPTSTEFEPRASIDNRTDTVKPNWLKTTIGKITVGGLLLAGLGGGAAALSANNAKDATPEPTPTASAPATPGAQESAKPTATETASATSSYELKAGQTPEQLAKDYMSVATDWVNAGCTSNAAKDFLNQNGVTPEQYSFQIATAEGKKRAVALLGPDYESDPALKQYVDNMITLNASVLNAYIRTSVGGGVGYEQTYKFDSLTSSTSDDKTTTLQFEGHIDNNSQAYPKILQPSPSGQKVSYTLTFVKSGNTEILTNSLAANHK